MRPTNPVYVKNPRFRDEFAGRHRVSESAGVSSLFTLTVLYRNKPAHAQVLCTRVWQMRPLRAIAPAARRSAAGFFRVHNLARSPVSLLSRVRCGSIRVKIHRHKALRHKSEPPVTFDFCKSPLLSWDGAYPSALQNRWSDKCRLVGLPDRLPLRILMSGLPSVPR